MRVLLTDLCTHFIYSPRWHISLIEGPLHRSKGGVLTATVFSSPSPCYPESFSAYLLYLLMPPAIDDTTSFVPRASVHKLTADAVFDLICDLMIDYEFMFIIHRNLHIIANLYSLVVYHCTTIRIS